MNISLSPPTTIALSWQDYIAGQFDRALIPWKRCRYSGFGVVEMPKEAPKNGVIAKRLGRLLEPFVNDPECQIFTDIIGIEIPKYAQGEHEERIPDLVVVDDELSALIDMETNCTITLDMPPPLLVVEVVSPSSIKDDIKQKSIEYKSRNVTDYLAIDWRNRVVHHWNRLGDDWYSTEYRDDDRIRLISFPMLNVTVSQLVTLRKR